MSYILFGLLCLGILFLYFTALSGVKFYETRLQREDVKNIKISIHVAMVTIAVILCLMLYKGNLNVSTNQEVLDTQKTEKVEGTKSATERGS
jgi:hypothetical protein